LPLLATNSRRTNSESVIDNASFIVKGDLVITSARPPILARLGRRFHVTPLSNTIEAWEVILDLDPLQRVALAVQDSLLSQEAVAKHDIDGQAVYYSKASGY